MLRSRLVNRAACALACARGHRLVLVYHRVTVLSPPGFAIVPSVSIDVFRAQMHVLGELVDLVSLDEILADRRSAACARSRRPAVAVTFDDDLPSHTSEALPVLRELQIPAAFFLSGRALYGLGPYWFQQLEALLDAHGHDRTAALIGVASAAPSQLAFACERDSNLRRRVVESAQFVPTPEILGSAGVTALAAAGMTIGFHTVNHAVLPSMDDAALDDALTCGRRRLAAAAGASVRYFAYPYGKADARCAAAVRRAGFDAAFTGRPEPLRPRDDVHRHHIGRWEPGPLSADDFIVKLAVRLHRAAPCVGHAFERSIAC